LNPLIEKYPGLFDLETKWGFIGFDTDVGWNDLIDKALLKLNELNNKDPELEDEYKIKVLQIKEKYGGLRLYTNWSNDAIDAIVDEAETEAAQTCEHCGSKDNVTTEGGWLKTYCSGCSKK